MTQNDREYEGICRSNRKIRHRWNHDAGIFYLGVVAFNKPSFDKFKGDINPDTRLFVDSTFVTAEDVSGTPAKQVFLFPATKYAEENFRVVCTNIVMMGYIVAHNPDISLENAQNAIRAVMNPKVVDLNLKALQFGYEHGKADLA